MQPWSRVGPVFKEQLMGIEVAQPPLSGPASPIGLFDAGIMLGLLNLGKVNLEKKQLHPSSLTHSP